MGQDLTPATAASPKAFRQGIGRRSTTLASSACVQMRSLTPGSWSPQDLIGKGLIDNPRTSGQSPLGRLEEAAAPPRRPCDQADQTGSLSGCSMELLVIQRPAGR